jgi:hypothetical protein
MKFVIEQLAIVPPDREAAIQLLKDIGLTEWAEDIVVAEGAVLCASNKVNVANLAFNYQASDKDPSMPTITPLEFEVLNYRAGDNWLGKFSGASHLGMHCTAEELTEWRAFFAQRGIGVAQEVDTLSHTNPNIAGKRWYKYVIFQTRPILGIDLKFIVRKDAR